MVRSGFVGVAFGELFSVTNNSSPSLGIFATPTRGFACWRNIAPAHENDCARKAVCVRPFFT